jgi:hypothetical protein
MLAAFIAGGGRRSRVLLLLSRCGLGGRQWNVAVRLRRLPVKRHRQCAGLTAVSEGDWLCPACRFVTGAVMEGMAETLAAEECGGAMNERSAIAALSALCLSVSICLVDCLHPSAASLSSIYRLYSIPRYNRYLFLQLRRHQ